MNADESAADEKRRFFDEEIRTDSPWCGVNFMRVIRSAASAIRVVCSAAYEQRQTSQTNQSGISGMRAWDCAAGSNASMPYPENLGACAR